METYLILLKGKDETKKIRSLNAIGDKIEVTFANGKLYSYARSNVDIYQDPILISSDQAITLVDGKRIDNMKQAQVFKHHVRIIYNSLEPEIFEKNRIKFICSCLMEQKSKDCFEYLKRLADECGLRSDEGERILGKYYSNINFVREDCVLATFLSGKTLAAQPAIPPTLIYPFGFNLSQKAAVDSALQHPLSAIEGPPGTGKTQTILNIIANAVMNNESVAVVSGNNSATANVLEKLEKNGVGFIAAPLGNNDNKKKFIYGQAELPDLSAWSIKKDDVLQLRSKLQELSTKLNEMLEKKNSVALLQRELENLELEHKHFEKYCGESYATIPLLKLSKKLHAQEALKLWVLCEDYASRNKSFGLWGRLIMFFRFGIVEKNFYKLPIEKMILACQKHFYTQKCLELRENIDTLSKILTRFSFDEKMKEYADMSMRLFQAYLCNKYEASKRKHYELNDLWREPDSFIKDYPVILSTTFSLRSSLSDKVVYDYVIIDEASQVDLATGALALSCAKKAVIVGDLKQLPHVVTDEIQQRSDAIFLEFELPECYRYSNHSLLRSISELFPDLPKTLLREHYRCHPKIIGFCNQKFYDNQLIILTEAKDERKPLMVYETVPGNHARQRVNRRQIDVIKKEILPQQLLDTPPSIGIATPYRNQANTLVSELKAIFEEFGIKADTVDKFQGRENDVIILSTVDNKITQFADNSNRLNVAVSRAIDQLILLLHGNTETEDSNIKDLVQYIKYNNLDVVKSEVHSIFDYLFKSYAEQRMELLKGQKRVSEYDSENLMYHLICDVLSQDRFSKYDVAPHIPLNMILRTFDRLDGAQTVYAMNPLTHIDFLIFNKLGGTPALAVEVDGAAFHKEGSRQKERDKMKEDILRKYELPLIRFRTDESGERERLEAALANM